MCFQSTVGLCFWFCDTLQTMSTYYAPAGRPNIHYTQQMRTIAVNARRKLICRGLNKQLLLYPELSNLRPYTLLIYSIRTTCLCAGTFYAPQHSETLLIGTCPRQPVYALNPLLPTILAFRALCHAWLPI